MRKFPVILSGLATVVFFILATATSQDTDFGIPFSINANVELDSISGTILLTNNDTLNFSAADLFITQPLDSTNSLLKSFQFSNYSLAMGDTDTIPLEFFTIGTAPYPTDTLPTSFSMFMATETGVGELFVTF